MRFVRTERFKKAYLALPPRDRERVKKALRLVADDPSHPSLMVKKVQGTADIRESRASKALRITFQREGDVVILRNCGPHDPTLKRP
ncbi:MAG: hypothetical protein QME76_12075 [Bacillota bacterium]|nr:hypothetical protein [Bacillota bacterium]